MASHHLLPESESVVLYFILPLKRSHQTGAHSAHCLRGHLAAKQGHISRHLRLSFVGDRLHNNYATVTNNGCAYAASFHVEKYACYAWFTVRLQEV